MLKKISIFIFLLFGLVSFVNAMDVPDTPTDLISTTAGSGEISLSWLAGPDGGDPITDYILEYKQTEDSSWLVFPDPVDIGSTGLVTGLSNGISYDFRVSAVNIHGAGSPSNVVVETPIHGIPTAPVVSNLSFDTPLALQGFTITASYDFLDVNADPDQSTYAWHRSTDVLGPYAAIPGATSLTYTPTVDDIGNYLRFEITPVTDVVPVSGVILEGTPTPLVAEPDYVNQILSTGQSVSIGTKAIPPISTIQPYGNLMLDGHPSSGWGAGVNLVPLVESHWETPGSGMANTISSLRPGTDVAIGLHGHNAVRYTQIKKGTGLYNKGQTQMVNTKAAAEALNRPYRVLGVTVIHGETDDFINTSGSTYKSYLEEFQSDYQSDIQAVTGQTETIPLFTDQESSFTSSYYVNKETSEIPLAQLQAAVDNPGKIVMVGPKYFFDYNPTDGAHITPEDSRLLGAYHGKVINHVVLEGKEWKPLMPENLGLQGDIIYVDYHVPVGELEIDTTFVAERSNYGFEFYDDEGSTVIDMVEILDTDTIKITLSQEPLGGDMKLRYAYRGLRGSYPDPLNPLALGGNIRDTDTTSSRYGNTLYNWAVQGEWDVEVLPEVVVRKKSGSSRRSSSEIKKIFQENSIKDIAEDSLSLEEDQDNVLGVCKSFNTNLRMGDRDGNFSSWTGTLVSSVAEFQSYLVDQDLSPGPVDGIYGPQTRSAVEVLQKTLNVDVDGIYGPITKKALGGNC